MPEVITAIYERGVFKPLQEIILREHQRVKLILEPNIRWHREFRNLLERIHNRTAKFTSAEIEKDITFAYRQVRRIKGVRKSFH